MGLEVTLIGHHSPITALVASKEYSVIVSADESGLCIIWDLNKYVLSWSCPLLLLSCRERTTWDKVLKQQNLFI